MSIYQSEGFENRKEYLNHLSEEYDIPKDVVYTIASMLGSSEDFDGLISALDDYCEQYF